MRYTVFFDGPPDHYSGRFLRVENKSGRFIPPNEIRDRCRVFMLSPNDFIVLDEEDRLIEREDARGSGKGGGVWQDRNGEWALVLDSDTPDFDVLVDGLGADAYAVFTYDATKAAAPDWTPWYANLGGQRTGVGQTAREALGNALGSVAAENP